jgi:NADP-dependent 3-hydroxy acid dehydrogenase YdfG
MTQKRFKTPKQTPKMATFLIIGASSADGSAIVNDLLSNGHKVFASYFRKPIEFKHP